MNTPTEQQIQEARERADRATTKARIANDVAQIAIAHETNANHHANQTREAIEPARRAHAIARIRAYWAELSALEHPTPNNHEDAKRHAITLADARTDHQNAIAEADHWTRAAIEAETAATRAKQARTHARHAAAQAQEEHEEMVRQAGGITRHGTIQPDRLDRRTRSSQSGRPTTTAPTTPRP